MCHSGNKQAIKNGTFDVKAHLAENTGSETPCPLKDKCPYYKDVKEHPEKMGKCPVAGACPHATKKKEKGEEDSSVSAEAAKCPHMAAAAAAAAAAKKATSIPETDVKVDL